MKWLAFFFTVFILVIIILADNGRLDSLKFIYGFPNGDKVGHWILFGLLTFLLDLTFFKALPGVDRKRVAVAMGLFLALIIGLEEYSQKFIPERTCSLYDLLASYVGVFFFSWLALKISHCSTNEP